MEPINDQLDELKDYVHQVLEEHELGELFSERVTENFFDRAPYNCNLWSLALRISDFLICSHQNGIRNAAF